MEKNVLRVCMLGQFTLWQEGMEQPQAVRLTGRSGRLWTLAAYLILQQEKGATTQELIDILWPEAEGANPASTLQNNASRARAALEALGFDDGKQLIRYEDGCYRWAPERETWLDAAEFERLARKALGETNGTRFQETARQAIGLYQGDLLPEAATEFWCVNLNTYYRSLYMRLCKKLAQQLMEAEQYHEAAVLCTKTLGLDPVAEEFSVLLMRALTRGREPQRALEHYESVRQLYLDSYGMTPSQELETEKNAALQELYGKGMDEQELKEFLWEDHHENAAFCCDNGTFREIVKLQLRAMRRDESQAQVMMVRLQNPAKEPERNAVYMKQMEQTLQDSLRAGDPFTRLGASQFWVLLPGAGVDDRGAIEARISSELHGRYPRSKARFQYKMMDLRGLRMLDGGRV